MTITRKKMARGTKVMRDHLTSATGAVATALSTHAIEGRDLVESGGVCRLNLHVPLIGSLAFLQPPDTTPGRQLFAIPFALPQFQETFRADGIAMPSDPWLVLDEVSLSFDQRGEAAAIMDGTIGADSGDLAYDAVQQLGMRVSIAEKRQLFFDANAGLFPQRELVAFDLPAESFSGEFLRLNPAVFSGIGKRVSNYSTFLLIIDAHDLLGTRSVGLPSFTVSMRFLTPLVSRRQLSEGLLTQNIPDPWGGDKVNATTAQVAIAANANITEANLQQNIVNVDDAFHARLQSGVLREGVPPPAEQIEQDSCYDIIAVPMWQWGLTAAQVDLGLAPYAGADPMTDPTCDRRILSLHYGFELHHAIAAVGYQRSAILAASLGLHPTNTTLVNRVGVALLMGKEGDDFGYQQVALGQWTPAGGASPKAAITIDKIIPRADSLSNPASTEPWDFELLSMALSGAGGTGYFAQGRPIFCGRTHSGGGSRSNINGGNPATNGRETHIEVRWQFSDPTDGLASDVLPATGTADPLTVYAGTGGHWVLLCGKKFAAGADNDVPV